jgi:hypothetical protein
MSSNIVKQSQLKEIIDYSWTKTKERYDDAFVDAELTAEEKKIKFTKKKGGDKVNVSLADYARLQDKNEFKQDVSADNVAIANNSHIGNTKGVTSIRRSLGFRQLTTSAFVDGYVDHIRIYLEASATGNATFKVWAITKNATDRTQDRVKKVIWDSKVLEVNSITEGTETKKFVIIPIEESFENETYFIARCNTHNVEVAQNIKAEYREDVVNLNDVQPPDEPNSQIDWTGVNSDNNTAIMYLYGRESIGSLSLKLKQTQADSSTYVKHTDCIDGTEQIEQREKAGKVVKLGTDGKLHSSLMPKIAINEYYPVTTFDHDTLSRMEYENGDVVVVTRDGQVTKRYLCIKKDKNQSNLTEGFVELNSKDGTITSINGNTPGADGNIVVTTKKTGERVSLSFGTDGTDVELFSYMTTDEVSAIKALFT